jgi:redox-sensitive bicupin YhaK (pirin superfamily)
MSRVRAIRRIIKSKPTMEGAGVRLMRVFGFGETSAFDPFLLLDHFGSDNPADYRKGFPWHPHRGIETITYVLRGDVEHQDSLGNKGVIGSGDVQWMTAGSGIIHQEMPRGDQGGSMRGFQLWANLPASHKMMDPRYRDVKSNEIPEVLTNDGARIKIVAGSIEGTRGPVQDIIIDPEYLDVTVPAGSRFVHPTTPGYTVFAFVFLGEAYFDAEKKSLVTSDHLVLFEDGENVSVSGQDGPVRFLLISGKSIREPVAWYGPIVMNTEEELRIAFEEFQNGTFIKQGRR